MRVKSTDPTTGKVIHEYDLWETSEIERALERATQAYSKWRALPLVERLRRIREVAMTLDKNKQRLAALITAEMGKPLRDSIGEIEKCAFTAKFLVDNLTEWLQIETVDVGGKQGEVVLEPMGTLIGVMPWNFPFWQVFRFVLPAVSLGNVILLKHSSNVFGCSEAIQSVFLEAGFPEGVFQHAPLSSDQVLKLIPDHRIRGVSLTGSVAAGRSVGEVAGRHLKKAVLELGGSDPYVILDDANLESAAEACVASRLINAGQSCISAKRFIVTEKNVDDFSECFIEKMKHKSYGDPKDARFDIGPMSRTDLRDELHEQVVRAKAAGATLALGGEIPAGPGAFYPPSVLTNVVEQNPAFREELFGPVAAIISARDEDDAIRLANSSSFGLGSAVFSINQARALEIARHRLESGMSVVNDFVRSDVRLPFGGIKDSGFGRELGRKGVLEFANIKSVLRGS